MIHTHLLTNSSNYWHQSFHIYTVELLYNECSVKRKVSILLLESLLNTGKTLKLPQAFKMYCRIFLKFHEHFRNTY